MPEAESEREKGGGEYVKRIWRDGGKFEYAASGQCEAKCYRVGEDVAVVLCETISGFWSSAGKYFGKKRYEKCVVNLWTH